jgi:AcrR family transcriptional regulator
MAGTQPTDIKDNARPVADAEERRHRGRPQVRSDEETRAIIFEAARHEFAERGFAATSVENIARRAGVSTKTVYRLIQNKAALFEGMITDRIDRFVSAVNFSPCENQKIEPALETALQTCADLILDPEVIALQRMILSESDTFPDMAETFYRSAMRRTVGAFAAWLEQQEKRGRIAIGNADDAAGMLLGMMAFEPQRAVWFGHKTPLDRKAIEARVRACVKLFLKGCGR